jgi:hypothetical protein
MSMMLNYSFTMAQTLLPSTLMLALVFTPNSLSM